MNINAITKYLVERGELQPLPAGVTQKTYEDLVRTSANKSWTPPTKKKLADTWKLIEPAISAAEREQIKAELFAEARQESYEAAGVTVEALVEALVEHIIENRPGKLAALQAKRLRVKTHIPKPKGLKR